MEEEKQNTCHIM